MAGLALLATACGGGGGSSSASSSNASGAQNTVTPTSTGTSQAGSGSGQKTFSSLNVTWDAPDYFDPGLAYTVAAWQVMWNVYEGLVGYEHVDGAAGSTIIPYQAKNLPTISTDGKDYKFTLRPNLKYSDGTAVKASDFTCTLKRDYKIDSPGVGFFSGIVGSDSFAKTKKGSISGITTNDQAGTIEIKLSAPQGDFLNILGTQFASFVPCSVPATDQSTKGLPATGPYTITQYSPNKSFTVKRNRNFNGQIPNIPKGNPDLVKAQIITDPTQALQTVLGGSSDYDFQPIPTDRLASVQKNNGDQLKLYTPANTYYFFLNSRIKPFSSLKARQAVEYAVNPQAIIRIFGGLGVATQNILPPTYPSYQKISAYSYDLAKAKQLVQQSGMAGTQVTVFGVNTDPSKSTVEYLSDTLNKIGFKSSPKLLGHSVYFTTLGNQATKAQIGYTDWYQDYPNPIDWFDVLFNGERITQTHNNNYGNADYKDVNQLIDKLKKQPMLTDQVNAGWADVDKKLIVEHAAAVPYLNREGTDFFSKRMDLSCYYNHVLYQWDFSTICVK